MRSFMPPRSPFGRGPSPFYQCKCPKCGFQQVYELGDPAMVFSRDESKNPIRTVKEVPDVCPKCGEKWEKTHMPDLRRW